MTPFQIANTAEGLLWLVLAAAVLLFSARKAPVTRRTLFLSAVLVLFGTSDFVEAQTGAWWRPWWLLLWKGLCVALFLLLLIQHYRAARR